MDLQKYLQECNAILKGHFVLSSGLHSDTYIQCASLMADGQKAEFLCKILAEKISQHHLNIDLIVSPAMGGVLLGYELSRQLAVNNIFVERVKGEFALRRSFNIVPGTKILVVEDVITTGKSSLETFEVIRKYGGNIIAEACLIDRRDNKSFNQLGVPIISLLEMEIQCYPDDGLPVELSRIPITTPGSRFANE